MNAVYVVIENGDPYPIAYTSYASAYAAVKENYGEFVQEEMDNLDEGIISVCSLIDVPENTLTGKTYLYIEKDIHIYIHKLPILSF
jgi:hypothetical protein